MNARVSKEEMALMMPTSLSQYVPISTIRTDTDSVNDRSIVQRLADGLRWLVELPRRRAVIDELSMLSDHELSDIGLSRAELSHVFDHSFVAQREGAFSRSHNPAGYHSVRV